MTGLAALMRGGCLRFSLRRQTLAALVLALALAGCKDPPAPPEAYAGEPLRALTPECGDELVDSAGKACVQIDVFGEGEGEAASKGEWVKVHYLVSLPEGAPLDSSHDGKPLLLRLGSSADVIEGVHLGVEGMKVGERRRVVVPPKLGYRGRKLPGIPPDANLVFLLELVERRPGG